MIYTIENDRYLKHNSPLIDYIRAENSYENENLIYTRKYSEGTFSVTNPAKTFKNCEFINGYPHFLIPLEVCIDEIMFFLSNGNMYSDNFYIRYGDTHPHKCIPKLAQIRNLELENSLSKMIGVNARSYYGIGDISIKTLRDFIKECNINLDAEDLYIKIVNNNLDKKNVEKLEKYDLNALKKISDFLKKLRLTVNSFLLESDLYKNQDLYHQIKSNSKYAEELKSNGEIKYSLQEIMVIKNLIKSNNDVLINIIGADQVAHVLKVGELLKDEHNIRNRFLTYEICRNGNDNDLNNWSKLLSDYIEKNNFKINDSYIDYIELLKILFITNSNDIIIDYGNLDTYKNGIVRFNTVLNSIYTLNDNYTIEGKNDLICKMALVCYNLNRTVEMGNPINFYKYLISIYNEYNANIEKYKNIQGLYKNFLIKGFEKIGYETSEKVRGLRI